MTEKEFRLELAKHDYDWGCLAMEAWQAWTPEERAKASVEDLEADVRDTLESLEETDESFYVSYKANDVYQGIIVNAPSIEIAIECFGNSMPGAELLGCREAMGGDFKPGMPVMDAKKYYKVEISHMASMGLTAGNTYTYWADKMPDYETVNKPMVDIHTAYFKDPVEAEDYRQHCLLAMGVTNEKVLADKTIREGHGDRKPALDDVVRDCSKGVCDNGSRDKGAEEIDR